MTINELIDNVDCEFGSEAAQIIEDMKCCGNCVYKECPNFQASGYCGTWRLDRLNPKDREEIIK